ncbi:Crp/Fnr family transcriptional regulator [Sphingobium nicotianae]|uniref:Crp/Fnr family transcriptional regulator n=1 Tax=Sphingobium nicotianae TaxID=2782607 RepID=UPI0032D9737E
MRTTALCASMTDEDLTALSNVGRRRVIPAGQILSWAGDESNLCANVVHGALKVTSTMADGREQIVGLLFPGDFVGQLFEDEMSMTVTAVVETDLCCYSRRAFEGILDQFPRLERMLLKRTMASLNDARNRMLSLGRKSAQERVAGFILELYERSRAAGESQVSIPVSRGEMADYLGLTIETVSRQLTRLRAANIIAFVNGDRDCRILDSLELEQILDQS